jgi:phenylpyruvate tautomerase PptA (4-oxalocrotonate tautomerase family)
MPNILISLPSGVLDPHSKARLSNEINAVAVEVEQIGDDPKSRLLCWVVIDEIAEGNWTCGGSGLSQKFVPVLVIVYVPAGVLDGARRVEFAQEVQRAVSSALAAEKRKLLVSCIFNEVEEGRWGVNGAIWELKDFARHAGYRHLQYMIDPSKEKEAQT